jgi:hypothetical protein
MTACLSGAGPWPQAAISSSWLLRRPPMWQSCLAALSDDRVPGGRATLEV